MPPLSAPTRILSPVRQLGFGISADLPTGSPAVSASGLVLAYDMETLTGALMKDFSGNANDGTISGATDATVIPRAAVRVLPLP